MFCVYIFNNLKDNRIGRYTENGLMFKTSTIIRNRIGLFFRLWDESSDVHGHGHDRGLYSLYVTADRP